MRSRTWTRSAVVAVTAVLATATAGCGSSSGHASAPTPVATAGPSTPSLSTTDPGTSANAPSTTSSGSWLGYHADQARTGAVPAAAGPAGPTSVTWDADLGAAVYGQPLVAGGRVLAATEDDRVVALSLSTGRVLWSETLGSPLTDVSSAAGCGDIDTLGVTSTPVVDQATGTLYVVGEVSTGGGAVHHQLVGYDVATGAVRLSEDVDPPLPPGEKPVTLLQRAGLALADGRVYVSYGGNYGDCGHYHGWVVGVEEAGAPDMVSFEVAADGEGGAVWMSGGAPAVDDAGDLYISTGNANPDPPEGGPDPKAYTESVVKLSPTLQPLASFKDRVAGGDEDLSTSNPVLLADGDVFSVGKTDIAYVLRQGDLSQVAAIKGVCGSDPDGGPVLDASSDTVYVPCKGGGIQVVDLASRTASRVLGGADGAPILVGSTLWALQYPQGKLVGYDVSGGASSTSTSVDLGHRVPEFVSPTAADGRLLVGTDQGVTALG